MSDNQFITMRPAPLLCLAALASCTYPDPDLRPAPPRRSAFGEAAKERLPGETGCSRVTIVSTAWAWETPGGWRIGGIDALEGEVRFGVTGPGGYGTLFRDAIEPALASDGNLVAWTVKHARDGARHQVVAFKHEGAVSDFIPQLATGVPLVISPQDLDARHSSCAPSSQVVAWEEIAGSSPRIWTTELSSGRRTFVTQGATPSWSPDGQWIAFESGAPSSIYKVRPDGTERTRLTEARDARRPTWSPDSRWIAFGQFDAEGKADDIWAIRSDGSRYLRVTWDPAPEWDPCWAPDGRILFTTIRNGDQGIWTVAPQNTELLK